MKTGQLLIKFIQSPTNPFDVPVDFRMLDVKEYGLSSPVIVGADLYLAAKVKRCKHYEIGFGYSFEQLFFDKQYGNQLTASSAGIYADALEMARWAPSAGNKQPWRAVVSDDVVHFYEEKSMKDSPLGDIQKVDVGIALAHFDLSIQEGGHKGRFVEADPGITLPENVQYVISYEREQ